MRQVVFQWKSLRNPQYCLSVIVSRKAGGVGIQYGYLYLSVPLSENYCLQAFLHCIQSYFLPRLLCISMLRVTRLSIYNEHCKKIDRRHGKEDLIPKIKIEHRTVKNGHISRLEKDSKIASFPRWKQDSKTFHLEQDSTEIIPYAERSNLYNRTDGIPNITGQIESQMEQGR